MRIPAIEDLSEYYTPLAIMVARTSWLPNLNTVNALQGAVFPTCRYKSNHERFSHIEENGVVIGMYDDNVTPEWALFWAHELIGTRPKGWAIVHVWPTSDDIGSYPHIANLAMVPESFASLTDKGGPLTAFLRWHAWHIYRWKPKPENNPTKPKGYDGIEWRYLKGVDDPMVLVRRRMHDLDNKRLKILRPIMERRKML